MLILINFFIFLIWSLPVSTINLDSPIIQIQQLSGSQFYIVHRDGIYLYDINTKTILNQLNSKYGNIIGAGYMNMPNRAVLPTTTGIVEYKLVNQIIDQAIINVQSNNIYFSNNHFYALKISDEREQDSITILDNQLNILRSFNLQGKVKNIYAGRKYLGLETTQGVYVLIGNSSIFIDDIKPSSMVWFGEDYLYIPFYQQLYILNLEGDVLEQRFINSSIYSVFQVQNSTYIHTIDGIIIDNKELDILPPMVKIRKYINENMVMIDDGKNTYLILNGIPVGTYEFNLSSEILYLPIQQLFLTYTNNTISLYSAASCYLHKIEYVDYCRDIEIKYNYFITPPLLIIENQTLPQTEGTAIIKWGEKRPGTYPIFCISSYKGNLLLGQKHTANLVILEKGKINNYIFEVYDKDNLINNYYITKNGTTLKFSVKDYKNISTTAKLEIYLFENLLENSTIIGTRSIRFDEPGDYLIKIYDTCYSPINFYVRIVKTEEFPWFIVLIFIILIIIIFVLMKLK